MMLKVAPGAKYSAILGVGWLSAPSGGRQRRDLHDDRLHRRVDPYPIGDHRAPLGSDDETIQMMSVAAARKALDRAGIEAGQIDTVIVSTVTHLYQTPAVATTIASELGAKSAAAFDISAACAGFCYATAMADSFIRSGASKYVLIIGVERLTDMTNRSDRSTVFLFADGAGAAVIGPSEFPGIGPVVWGSDGDQAPLIQQTEPWDAALAWDTESYRSTEGEASWPTLKMEGNPVFKWASYTMAKTAAEALDAAGVRPEDLDVFAPHQANMRITDAMFRASNCRAGSSSHAISPGRAIPPPHRFRWPSRLCWSPARPIAGRPA